MWKLSHHQARIERCIQLPKASYNWRRGLGSSDLVFSPSRSLRLIPGISWEIWVRRHGGSRHERSWGSSLWQHRNRPQLSHAILSSGTLWLAHVYTSGLMGFFRCIVSKGRLTFQTSGGDNMPSLSDSKCRPRRSWKVCTGELPSSSWYTSYTSGSWSKRFHTCITP